MSSQNKKSEAIKTIIQKSASDADFRARALQDPAAVLLELGVELAPGEKIRFVDKLDEVVIVLPPANSKEITDEKFLASVAGGMGDPYGGEDPQSHPWGGSAMSRERRR
jgi:hypothetical protein